MNGGTASPSDAALHVCEIVTSMAKSINNMNHIISKYVEKYGYLEGVLNPPQQAVPPQGGEIGANEGS